MSYQNLTVERQGSIFIITMRKPPENRINVAFAQELIKAFRDIEAELGRDTEGAVIVRGSDAKFWCTVHPPPRPRCPTPFTPIVSADLH